MTDINSKVNVAFIGAGQFANLFHYSTLSTMEDVRIAAIADLDEDRRAKTGAKYGVPDLYGDYAEMLQRDDIDAVYVVMRPHLLKPIALDVIDAGKAVFTEKPLGQNSGETEELAKAAQEAAVLSCVGLNRRYCAVIRKARELVLERGPISGVLAEFHKDMKREMFGMSMLYADGLHALDPLRFWAGEPTQVQALADTRYGDAEWQNSNNVYHALMRFDSGAGGLFAANRQAGGRYERFEIHGNGISAYLRPPNLLEVWRTGEKEPETISGADLVGSDDMLMTYGYWHENRAFVDCLKSGQQPETSFADNLQTMRLCDAIESGAHFEENVGGQPA